MIPSVDPGLERSSSLGLQSHYRPLLRRLAVAPSESYATMVPLGNIFSFFQGIVVEQNALGCSSN
jgi:hypothetical protein